MQNEKNVNSKAIPSLINRKKFVHMGSQGSVVGLSSKSPGRYWGPHRPIKLVEGFFLWGAKAAVA